MITLGRRNKSILVGAALILVLLLVSLAPTASTPQLSSIQKVDYGIGESVSPLNGEGLSAEGSDSKTTTGKSDTGLLSGAKIDQDATAEKEKMPPLPGSAKVDTVSGSDASLKTKQDSVNKGETNKGVEGSFADSPDSKQVSSSNTKSSSKSSSKSTDGVEYVIMIDAGSTGSRVHVYSFDTTVSPPSLLKEEFKMLKPGLSSFNVDTVGAAESLNPLLDLALSTIPKDKHSCSPVALKATAGLRLLGKTKSDAILKEVRRHLEEDYPFPVVEGDGISIMDGSDEGVFAWITTNYLLNNIGTSKRLDTAAVFDLGGGSTQIVFEPTNGEKLMAGDHKYEIEFGGRQFTLYQHSHLGYGLMEARNKVNAEVLKSELKLSKSKFTALTEAEVKTAVADVTVEHPCVPAGVNADNVIVKMDDGTKYAVNFISPAKDSTDPLAKSSAGQCKFLTDSILNKELDCESKSCSFNGIYQPSFATQFPASADMYIFSYFYDRLQPIGMPASFTLNEMNDIMKSVCAGSHLWDTYFTQKSHIKELEDEPLWCLDLNFMTSLLHTGYDIPLTRELSTAETIGGNELGWCLGASLPLLDKTNWSCKVTKQF